MKKFADSRIGNRWTEEEEISLLDSIASHSALDELALKHKRTPNGILCRMKKIAATRFIKGEQIEELLIIFKNLIDKKDITEAAEKIKNKSKQMPSTQQLLVEIRDLLEKIVIHMKIE
uniref:Uncharacterized protein n=1 Tax=Marseillevirus LCMAC102 TaxID=2506603 RepID=A0A481YTI3_9VIRU|nr:MAG: hypothetical protein LCMAC102_00320 [Marseillevirus LCMAC102]